MPSVLFSETRGADWEWQIQCLLDESDVPISGLGAATSTEFVIKRFADDASAATATGSVSVVDDDNGIVMLTTSAAESAKLNPGYWWCQVKFVIAGKTRKTNPFALAVRGSVTSIP